MACTTPILELLLRRMSSMQPDAADEVEVGSRDHVAAHILDHNKVDHTTWSQCFVYTTQ